MTPLKLLELQLLQVQHLKNSGRIKLGNVNLPSPGPVNVCDRRMVIIGPG